VRDVTPTLIVTTQMMKVIKKNVVESHCSGKAQEAAHELSNFSKDLRFLCFDAISASITQ